MRRGGAGLIVLLTAVTTACDGAQSMLEPAGPGAAAIAEMWWVLLAICTAVFVVVMAALTVALWQARSRTGQPAAMDRAEDHRGERRRVLWVLIAGAAVPAVILIGIFVYTMVVLERIGPSSDGRGASAWGGAGAELTVEITGKQYWWEVRYRTEGGDPVVTANEIHIPVGRRVRLLLESDDVIHSLWVPQLHGKTDMIPGRTTEAWLLADEPGVYRGQCAEYCGVQHTWMALHVVAEPEAEFRSWLRRQARPAPAPAPAPDPAEIAMDHAAPPVPDSLRDAVLARAERIRRGREVFFDPAKRCADCHVIRGENDDPRRLEEGTLQPGAAPGDPPGRTAEGPDLTHVASRRALAAGLLPMTRGNMAGWIANPQVLKPGNLMPRVPLEPEEMNALLEYLMSLR